MEEYAISTLFSKVMFTGYGEVWACRQESVEETPRVFTDQAATTGLVDPWFTSDRGDFLLFAEFSEIDGPRPLFTVGPDDNDDEQTSNLTHQDGLVLRLLSASQTPNLSDQFSVEADSQLLYTEETVRGLAFYVTLYDVEARGTVRPHCLCYVTCDRQKLCNNLPRFCEAMLLACRLLKFANLFSFQADLKQRLGDLRHTRRFLEVTRVAEQMGLAGQPADRQPDADSQEVRSLDCIDEAIGSYCQMMGSVQDVLHRVTGRLETDETADYWLGRGVVSQLIAQLHETFADQQLKPPSTLNALKLTGSLSKQLRPIEKIAPFATRLAVRCSKMLLLNLSQNTLQVDFLNGVISLKLDTRPPDTSESRAANGGQLEKISADPDFDGIDLNSSSFRSALSWSRFDGDETMFSLRTDDSEFGTPSTLTEIETDFSHCPSEANSRPISPTFFSAVSSVATPMRNSPVPFADNDDGGGGDDDFPAITKLVVEKSHETSSADKTLAEDETNSTVPTSSASSRPVSLSSGPSRQASLSSSKSLDTLNQLSEGCSAGVGRPSPIFCDGARFSLFAPSGASSDADPVDFLPYLSVLNAHQCFSGSLLKFMSKVSGSRDVIESIVLDYTVVFVGSDRHELFLTELLPCLRLFLPHSTGTESVVPFMSCWNEEADGPFSLDSLRSRGLRLIGLHVDILMAQRPRLDSSSQSSRARSASVLSTLDAQLSPQKRIVVLDLQAHKFHGPSPLSEYIRTLYSRQKHYKSELSYFPFVLSKLVELKQRVVCLFHAAVALQLHKSWTDTFSLNCNESQAFMQWLSTNSSFRQLFYSQLGHTNNFHFFRVLLTNCLWRVLSSTSSSTDRL